MSDPEGLRDALHAKYGHIYQCLNADLHFAMHVDCFERSCDWQRGMIQASKLSVDPNGPVGHVEQLVVSSESAEVQPRWHNTCFAHDFVYS